MKTLVLLIIMAILIVTGMMMIRHASGAQDPPSGKQLQIKALQTEILGIGREIRFIEGLKKALEDRKFVLKVRVIEIQNQVNALQAFVVDVSKKKFESGVTEAPKE